MHHQWTHLQHGLALCTVHPGVGCFLSGDGEALSPPQHGGGRVGHHIAAYVDWIPLPRVVDGVVGQELWYICPKNRDAGFVYKADNGGLSLSPVGPAQSERHYGCFMLACRIPLKRLMPGSLSQPRTCYPPSSLQ